MSDLNHGDNNIRGLNQISLWFQGYIDRRLDMMLNANQTECPFCEEDLRTEGMKLSRLPFDTLPTWLKSNIVCRDCSKTCKKNWKRIRAARNIETARDIFDLKFARPAPQAWEKFIHLGCVMCDGTVRALDRRLGLNFESNCGVVVYAAANLLDESSHFFLPIRSKSCQDLVEVLCEPDATLELLHAGIETHDKLFLETSPATLGMGQGCHIHLADIDELEVMWVRLGRLGNPALTGRVE